MTPLLTMGEALSSNAWLYPEKCGARDLARSMTFRKWNQRSCQLAEALLGLGLEKGDRIAVLAYNCVEWMEIYAATAKAGLVAVPINFRLREDEIRYIVEDCAARAFIVQHDLVESIASIRGEGRSPPKASSISAKARHPPGSPPTKS
jgi:fatty-acyl-CoA synthase